MDKVSDDLKLYPDKSFNHFTETCETLTINFDDNDVNDDILIMLIPNIITFITLIKLNQIVLHP